MPKGIFALNGAPKVKRIARTMFWLAFISAASRHDILLGVVLYPIAAVTVVLVAASPVLLAGGLLLAWYWHRHHRLPGWLSRRLPARLRGVSPRRMFRQARGRLMDVFPGHRRRVRRRWPRHPQPWETPTDEFPVLLAPQRQAPPPGEPPGVAFDRALARLQQRKRPPA
ncbi:MAG TPA: hypothetical protein VGL57_13325 [Solirubrobacteraceae bacterium]|jgi:hypothetical protein